MAHTARVEFPCPDAATAAAVRKALRPELAEGPEGSVLRLRQDGATLHLGIEAPELATLRAALQSTVRLLDAALAVVQ